jgi:transglutaminase-like putative cysteine protease
VWESHNLVRACPATRDGQVLHHYRLDMEPGARLMTYVDRWGTRVDAFGILEPHDELVVVASSRVSTSSPPPAIELPLSELGDEYREGRWLFLQPTRHTRWGPELADTARQVAAETGELAEAVGLMCRVVNDRMEYRTGATAIGVDVNQVWEGAAGVCQDFAHLTVAMLRAAGIAARYVSGYFYAADPHRGPSDDEGEIVVQTHAWVEAGAPDGTWLAVDPTNGSAVGERHVAIGVGRDYDDVAPLKGVYYGDSEHHLAAEVTMSTGVVTRTVLPDVPEDVHQQ